MLGGILFDTSGMRTGRKVRKGHEEESSSGKLYDGGVTWKAKK
jgi:hypothetical protein